MKIDPAKWYLFVSPFEASVGAGLWQVVTFDTLSDAATYRDAHDLTKDHAILSGKELISAVLDAADKLEPTAP